MKKERVELAKNQVRHFPIPELEMYLTDSLPGFSCKRCARCCEGKLIPLYRRDIERIQPYVKEKFYGRTTRLERLITGTRYRMLMKEDRCIFLDAGLCKHYDLRPNTCRRHPFLVTERYLLVSSTCGGINWDSHQSSEEYRIFSVEIAKSMDSFLRRTYLR